MPALTDRRGLSRRALGQALDKPRGRKPRAMRRASGRTGKLWGLVFGDGRIQSPRAPVGDADAQVKSE
jgi:hypothetical protein